jgi:membrane protease YdiL (CAAX protease family)
MYGLLVVISWLGMGQPVLDAVFLPALLVMLPVLAVAQLPLVAEEALRRIPVYVGSGATILLLGACGALLGLRRDGPEAMGLTSYPAVPFCAWTVGILASGVGLLAVFLGVRRRLNVEESPLVMRLLPETPSEKAWFVGLSFAAGFGEEIAFRGYAISTMTSILPSPWVAAVVTSVSFGFLHSYQGVIGIVRTTLLGLVLATSFVMSGSLWPPIAAHVAIDLLAGLVLQERLTG